MDTKDIERVKEQYDDIFGRFALEVCEKDPMFWAQDERACRKELEYWSDKIADLVID